MPKSLDRAEGRSVPPQRFDPAAKFTLQEVAEIYKVPLRRVKRWVYNGSLGYELMPGGRGRRVTGEHLNAAMAAGNRPPENKRRRAEVPGENSI